MTTSDTPRTDALSKSTDVIVADMAVLSRQLERENNVLQSQLAEKDAVLAVLLDALAEIREVWAGSEAGEPVHAQEAYAIRLCKQQYQIAVDAIQAVQGMK